MKVFAGQSSPVDLIVYCEALEVKLGDTRDAQIKKELA